MTPDDLDSSQPSEDDGYWPTWLPRLPAWLEAVLATALTSLYGIVFFVAINEEYTLQSDAPRLTSEAFVAGLAGSSRRAGEPLQPPGLFGQQVVNALLEISSIALVATLLLAGGYMIASLTGIRVRRFLIRLIREVQDER